MNELVSRYGAICRLITELFPKQIEAVLHDASTGKIVAIEGAYSNRKVGDKSLIEVDQFDQSMNDSGVIGPYPQANWDGEQLRSFTAVLTDAADNHKTIGFLCVNCRTSAFSAASELLATFANVASNPQPKALFEKDWRNSINQLVSDCLVKLETTLISANKVDKIEIVRSLDHSGLLEFRGSPDHVAQTLGMSRASFYNLLKESRVNSAAS